jgi:hypothetical protein
MILGYPGGLPPWRQEPVHEDGDARAYNELITAWSSIEQAASAAGLLGAQ